MSKKLVLGLTIVGLVIGSFVGIKSIRTVKSGYSGVVSKFGNVQSEVLESGIHMVNPITTKVIQMNNQIQRTDVDITGASKDLQTITGSISVNYNLTADYSSEMYKTIGKNFDEIIVRPAVQETTKSIISKYTAEELVTKRSDVSVQMQQALEDKISTYGLVIKEFNIINLDFTEEFNKAIEAKQTAQQNALKAQQDLERIKVEAEQKITQARADAEEYKLKSQELTDEMIKIKFIEKWDGHMPTVVSDGTNVMDVSKMIDVTTNNK